MSGYVYALIGVNGVVALLGVIYLIKRWIDSLRASGVDAQRAVQAEADLKLSKKQGEIMTRDESDVQLNKSLDDGSF